MNNKPVIELAADVPEAAAAILQGLERLTIERGRGSSQLRFGETLKPLIIVAGGLAPYASATAPLLASIAGDNRLALVVAERLSAHVRRELEEAGCAYADGTGAVHIDIPGMLLHIESTPKSTRILPPPGLGVVAVRLVQTLLAQPEHEWTVASLAEMGGSSTGQAHNVLARLESEGFVLVSGRGPARRRRVERPGKLLDWLATVPSARRIRDRLPGYMYAPDNAEVLTRLANYAFQSGVSYAVTGTAGAAVLGAHVATATPEILVRIAPSLDIRDIAELLHVEPVSSGANLVLVSDVGELGIHGAQRNGPVSVASAVRIWLDMLGEPRGDDAAALFREVMFGW